MTIVCRDLTQLRCSQECTRWNVDTLPLLIFHDTSAYDADCYPLNSTGLIDELNAAIDMWNEAYTCGTFFQLTSDRAQAHVISQFRNTDQTNAIATASCFCGPDGEDCPLSVDQSEIFMPDDNPAIVSQICNPNFYPSPYTTAEMTAVYLHELGHILGINHSPAGVPSVMVAVGPLIPQLFAWDIEQMNRRYPCGCDIINPSNLATPDELNALGYSVADTTLSCPACASGFGRNDRNN